MYVCYVFGILLALTCITPRFASRALSSGLFADHDVRRGPRRGGGPRLDAYVREYVGAQLAVGVLPAQILASFGAVGQADDPLPVDTAELCRLVLKRVHSVQDEQLPRALVAAAREGRVDEALSLLEAGAPWDAIDECGHSAGAYALRDGHAVLLDKRGISSPAQEGFPFARGCT